MSHLSHGSHSSHSSHGSHASHASHASTTGGGVHSSHANALHSSTANPLHASTTDPNTGLPITLTWANWGTMATGDTVAGSVNKIQELRDKITYLQANKGQYTAANGSNVLVPTNPDVDVSGAVATNFAAGVKVSDVEYDALQASTEYLHTRIVGAASGIPVRNAGDIIYDEDLTAIKTKLDAIASKDVSSPATPWHHSHANHGNHSSHANHGNHSSHTNHANHSSTSDKRLKKNINYLQDALAFVSQLKTVAYEWIDAKDERVVHGFIAQDIEELMPEWITTDDNGIKHIEPEAFELFSILTAAIQEQQAIINALVDKVKL